MKIRSQALIRAILTVFVLSLVACGGGGEGSSAVGTTTGTAGQSVSNGAQYPDSTRTYPYNDSIVFDRQNQGDVLSLSDRSLWYITGDFSAGQDALNRHDITLYEDGGQYGQPNSGARSTHYMYIDGSSKAFYLEYVPNLQIHATDQLPFWREKLGSLIAQTNGDLWLIVGVHSSGQDILRTHTVYIYKNLTDLPNLANTGRQADHYMHAESSSRGFYIEPINGVTIERSSSANFNRERVGNNIQLNDGSLWHIAGEHKFGQDVLDNHPVLVYGNVAAIPDPTSGQRADHYIYIYGASAGFFVQRL